MTTPKKLTNLDYLIELSKGNTGFVQEMIGIFLTENPEELSLLEAGIHQNDFALIRSSAHKMKSTIPFVGLDKIIGVDLSEIERLAKEETGVEQIQLLFIQIKNACLKASDELRE